MSTSRVVNTEKSNGFIVQLDSLRTLESIQDCFDCHTRPNGDNEAILDGIFLEEEGRLVTLCELLNVWPHSKIGKSISKAGFIVFFV